MTLDYTHIISALPYDRPFLFVDEILESDENSIRGSYTFREDEYFYAGHFRHKAVTPGVILTECMAQIGLVCLIYCRHYSQGSEVPAMALSETAILFERPVYPGEKVIVHSQLIYCRLGKLKCEVRMENRVAERICRGTIAGIILKEGYA